MPVLILIAEDNPIIREILAQLLIDEGYRVLVAADGQEALDYAILYSPDLIVSDIKMPRLHGLALVERLRAGGNPVPVVLISTWTPPNALPGVRFVRKPFDLDAIIEAVELSLAVG